MSKRVSKKVIDYKMCYADTPGKFEREVNHQLNAGCELYGVPFATVEEDVKVQWYHQAMVLRE